MTREKKKSFSTSLVNVCCLLAPARARDGLSSLPALLGRASPRIRPLMFTEQGPASSHYQLQLGGRALSQDKTVSSSWQRPESPHDVLMVNGDE